MMLSDQNIIELLQAKDKKAISLLYDRYSAALYGVACRIVRSEALAQDVLQDAFIKIWKNSASYKPAKGTLFTWMLNITRNTAIDKTRSAHFKQRTKVQSIDQFVDSTAGRFTEEMNVNYIGIRKKIEILEEKYKTIIDLIYFNGYTQRETAEHLGLPLGTVKSRVKIALRELRNALSDNIRVSQTSIFTLIYIFIS